MDRQITPSIEIPPASLSIFITVISILGIPIYDLVFVPFIRRFTKNPSGITCLQRLGVAYGINIFSALCSVLVEAKRKKVAAKYNLLDKPASIVPISVFWLVPEFCIDGIADVFWAARSFEFLYDQSPESMRSTTLAIYWVGSSMEIIWVRFWFRWFISIQGRRKIGCPIGT